MSHHISSNLRSFLFDLISNKCLQDADFEFVIFILGIINIYSIL